ncbi:pilus assembly protein PilM [bacterium]|nr:pilus assembly protein PilM [bacterium]
MSGGLLGLHFTPEELFIAVGQKRGRTSYLSDLDVIDIRQHVLEGGEFNQLTLAPVIQQVLKNHRIKTKRSVISFPVKFPWIRVIEIPQMPEREMARIVRLEVERLYLDSTVEKLIDYHVLGPAVTKQDHLSVLSCAIPRNSIAPYVDLVAASKLELVGIDLVELNVLKLATLTGARFDDGITLILNFNMQSIDLMLMEDDRLQLVRKVGQGKQQLRDVLHRVLPEESGARNKLDSVEFELPADYLHLAGDYVSNLLGEIRRSIEFYLTDIKRKEGSVTKVILAGSGYWPVNLPKVLALQLNLPLIDLRFDHIPNVSCQTIFAENFPALGIYAPVVGSVLRGVA